MPIAANELIDRLDQGVEFMLGISLEISEFLKADRHALHALRETNFGLGYAADQVGEGRNRTGEGRNRRLQLSDALFVPLGGSFEPRLNGQNELHGFFDVHPT